MLTDFVDAYCERTDAAFWSEPTNALTNLAFFFAACLVWRQLRSRPGAWDLRALALVIAFVGAGSLAFHTFAQRWAMFLDVGFITVFLLAFLHRFLIRIAGWRAWAAACGVVAFVLLDTVLKSALSALPLNGSEMYAAAFVVLIAMAIWSYLRKLPAAPPLALAAGMFLVSVTLRSLDQALCPIWPAGTHFAWHLLNAAVLWACMRGLIAGTSSHQARNT